MEIKQDGNNIVIKNMTDFCLEDTFDCGQCFRWNKDGANAYIGAAMGKALRISSENQTVTLYDTSEEDYRSIWENYFDFGRDYGGIKKELSKDGLMRKAVEYGGGIHILKQDIWECLVSFIISASNHIPRIKKIIELLCTNFGEPGEYMGRIFYSFPAAEKIASLSLDELGIIRAGFRDKYILAAAKAVVSGDIDIYGMKNLETQTIKKELMKISGVGSKVADCVLLFGYSRYDSFPVDVWMKRVMEHCYFDGKQKPDDIQKFAENKFGGLCGFAQQYLFYYGRENNIGIENKGSKRI